MSPVCVKGRRPSFRLKGGKSFMCSDCQSLFSIEGNYPQNSRADNSPPFLAPQAFVLKSEWLSLLTKHYLRLILFSCPPLPDKRPWPQLSVKLKFCSVLIFRISTASFFHHNLQSLLRNVAYQWQSQFILPRESKMCSIDLKHINYTEKPEVPQTVLGCKETLKFMIGPGEVTWMSSSWFYSCPAPQCCDPWMSRKDELGDRKECEPLF